MWLYAPNINCTHGFSTRHGGVSGAPFDTLNLGGQDDKPQDIDRNRRHALKTLKLEDRPLSLLKQVHSNTVCTAGRERQQGDALVSNVPGQVIAVSVADCFPILLYDETNKVIGAAHAGWRGTLAGIGAETIKAMLRLGAEAAHIRVAIGQGISQKRFEVGEEVIRSFKEKGFPESCWKQRLLDLAACNRFVLEQEGINPGNIWSMNRCTYEPDFFSYRRDNGITGRMWGLIALQ